MRSNFNFLIMQAPRSEFSDHFVPELVRSYSESQNRIAMKSRLFDLKKKFHGIKITQVGYEWEFHFSIFPSEQFDIDLVRGYIASDSRFLTPDDALFDNYMRYLDWKGNTACLD